MDVPAVFWSTYIDGVPKLPVAFFVVDVQVVEIKSADIGLNLHDAVKAPVLLAMAYVMTVHAGVSTVIPMRLKLRLVEFINVVDVFKNLCTGRWYRLSFCLSETRRSSLPYKQGTFFVGYVADA